MLLPVAFFFVPSNAVTIDRSGEVQVSNSTCRWILTRDPVTLAHSEDFDVILTDDMEFVSSLQPDENRNWIPKDPNDSFEDPRAKNDGFNRMAVLSDGRIIAHFDDLSIPFDVPEDLPKLFSIKTELLSVVLPRKNNLLPSWERIISQMDSMEDVYYMDTNETDKYERAFSKYKFSLILDESNHKINEAFIQSLAYHTLPAFNGFFEIATMFNNGVASYNETHFNMEIFNGLLENLTKQQKFIWSYQAMLQETLHYRYGRPTEERLAQTTDNLCRYLFEVELKREDYRDQPMIPYDKPNTAFLGIYSARNNFDKRMAIRETWLQIFRSQNIGYKFFLSSTDDADILQESAKYQDVIFLPVDEGYRRNSRKGLQFLQWVDENVKNYGFLIKADDDIYLRPLPILMMINNKIPSGFVWGFFDYISPVPRDEKDYFHNGFDDYPYSTFPPYARGVVRVLSADVVHGIAHMGSQDKLRMIFGDDPCFGVHLRTLVLERNHAITMDDFGSYSKFAMVPTCDKSWSGIKDTTLVVHHVSAATIKCMWEIDQRENVYSLNRDLTDHKFPLLCDCVEKKVIEQSS
jgi:Galactosyltransferase